MSREAERLAESILDVVAESSAFDEKIGTIIDSKLEDFEIEADNVTHFEREVESIVERHLEDNDRIEKSLKNFLQNGEMESAVRDHVRQALYTDGELAKYLQNTSLPEILQEFFKSQQGQQCIKVAILQMLGQVFRGMTPV